MDRYELALEEQLKILLDCQTNRDNTCMKCEYFIECETRKEYVNAVYLSMNKGSNGGFEF